MGMPADFFASFNQCDSLFEATFEEKCEFTTYLHNSYDRYVQQILYGSRAFWDAQSSLVSKKGYLYVYSDWLTTPDGKQMPGLKIGDGQAFLIDLPVLNEDSTRLLAHIEDANVHVSAEEKLFWNNKVSCYMDESFDGENLIFTTD